MFTPALECYLDESHKAKPTETKPVPEPRLPANSSVSETRDPKEKMLYLSSHIDELTEDIEQLQSSLLDSRREVPPPIREEVDDLSPISAGKNGNSCWSVNASHVFCEGGNKEKENRTGQDTRATKLQEEYAKVKTKMQEYQQNNATYLEEIKRLKEQLVSVTGELKANKERDAPYSSVSMKEATECKRRIGELEQALEAEKEQIIQLENKCLKLKLEKEQLGIKLEKRSPLLDYLKTGIMVHDMCVGLPSIIEKMVLLITAIEREARLLMKKIRKYKSKKQTEGDSSEDETRSRHNKDSDSEEEEKGRHCRVSGSLEKIGCLEKEIKQICSRISNLNKCVNFDSEDELESKPEPHESSSRHRLSQLQMQQCEYD